MVASKTRSLGAVNVEANIRNQKHLNNITENPYPRPSWQGNPPPKPLTMSAELRAYFFEMAVMQRVGWICRRCRVSQSHAAVVNAVAFSDWEARS